MTSTATTGPEAPAPRFARSFVAVFLVAIVVCPLALIEAWPFNTWRLFSHVRRDAQSGWQAVAVDRAGVEHPYPVASLGHGYRGFGFLMRGFASGSPARRRALCDAWIAGARERDPSAAAEVRLYRLRWLLSARAGDRARPPTRTLAFTCTRAGAHAAA